MCCCQPADHLTSKEQKAVRDRVSALTAALKKTVDKYNTIRGMGLSTRAEVTSDEIMQGELPWTYGDSSGMSLWLCVHGWRWGGQLSMCL